MKKHIDGIIENSMYIAPLVSGVIVLILRHLFIVQISDSMVYSIIGMSATFLGFSFMLQAFLATIIDKNTLFIERLRESGWFDVLNKNFNMSYLWHFGCIFLGIFEICSTPVFLLFIMGLSNNAVASFILAQICQSILR